ncbi:PAS domain-containing protein [Caulobacter sp. Root655]|uniref:PAS domain-containing protein n=1 Tax=Caulobacter sp. Root655 TaxID=1736578 RepID=UPI001F239844|nr:PAS domain-containing protein [Caulobacter sp. Root655]
MRLPWTAPAMLIACALIGVALLTIGPGNYPELHTVLDTGMALLSVVLALMLWDTGEHLQSEVARRLAIGFAATALMELVHILVAIEWSGVFATISAAKGALRPSTWPPPSHLLPLSVLGALLWPKRGRLGLALFAASIAAVAAVLFAVFHYAPRYAPPGLFGVTRPALVFAPVLWVAAGSVAWRLRGRERVAAALPTTAAVLLIANIVMLYSRAPADGPAMVAHLGKMAGDMTLLLFLLRMASSDLQARVRAEAGLSRLNAELDQRVGERTGELMAANRTLEQEIKARRESQRLLEAIVENSPAVIYVKDLEGRYLLVNRRYGDIFHVDADAMVGQTDHDIFSKDIADAFRAMDVRVATAGQPLLEEEVAPHDDGPHTYVSVKSPLLNDAGEPYAIFGISTDITERKQAEIRVQTQLERLALLDEITRAIGLRQDIESIFQVVVRSIESQLPADFACLCLYDGLDRTLTVAAVGVNSQALALELAMPERARIEIDENGLSRCVKGQLVYEADIADIPFPFPQRLARGGLRALVAAPLQAESKVFGVIIVARFAAESFVSGECEFLRQLSEHVALAVHQAQLHQALQDAYDDLRQSQQTILQQERLRALGQMASGIAHDINNALSPVALYTESMLETETSLSAEARGNLQVIQRAVEDVSHTIARMKEFYRQREPQLVLAPVRLHELVQQVLDLTKARWSDMAMQRGVVIEVRTELMEDLPPTLGVESEIREALINLVFNAIDAMPDGGTLTLRIKPAAGGKGRAPRVAEVEIEDTGSGMDEETRRRCLEPFYTTKGERGTGLGLAMVYGVAQRHGAELDVRSALGEGTTVRLSFPAPAEVAIAAAKSDQGVMPQRLRLLLVDDDPVLLKALGDTLSADGHVVTTAHDGRAGIDAFAAANDGETPFAAVITDLGMPKIDGWKVAAEIKALSPSTPVILLTGWGQGLLADADIPPHVDQLLSKPPKLREIREALANLCPEATP